MDDATSEQMRQLFLGLEASLVSLGTSASLDGPDERWERVQTATGDAWVLEPPPGTPRRAVVHFVGGALVGASPQLAYRLVLERLARGGATVVATRYSLRFDHSSIADALLATFQATCEILAGREGRMSNGEDAGEDATGTPLGVPVVGVGHSLGCLMHLLACVRKPQSPAVAARVGNVLMSFNAKPATDAIPAFSSVIAPGVQGIGESEVVRQALESPLGEAAMALQRDLRDVAPPLLAQALPLVDQLEGVYDDIAQGVREFKPSSREVRAMVREGYATRCNLLIKFTDDSLDETDTLASWLQGSDSAASLGPGGLDLTVRVLQGTHVRPLQQQAPDLAKALGVETGQAVEATRQANAAFSSGLDLLGGLALQAGLGAPAADAFDSFRKVGASLQALGEATLAPGTKAREDTEELAGAIEAWVYSHPRA